MRSFAWETHSQLYEERRLLPALLFFTHRQNANSFCERVNSAGSVKDFSQNGMQGLA